MAATKSVRVLAVGVRAYSSKIVHNSDSDIFVNENKNENYSRTKITM